MAFTSPLTRVDPPRTNPETAALNSWLEYNRATLLGKLDGLTEEQAGRPMVGSGTTLHGVVRHMTTMEQFFFIECVGGLVEPYPYYDGEDVDWDWDLDRSEGLQADVDRYVAVCERARAITADVDPDTVIVTRRGSTVDVRWVLLGQIQEYARHNGHADIVRELIDGTTGE